MKRALLLSLALLCAPHSAQAVDWSTAGKAAALAALGPALYAMAIFPERTKKIQHKIKWFSAATLCAAISASTAYLFMADKEMSDASAIAALYSVIFGIASAASLDAAFHEEWFEGSDSHSTVTGDYNVCIGTPAR